MTNFYELNTEDLIQVDGGFTKRGLAYSSGTGALSGAISGAEFGAVLGPEGAVAGAFAGALWGATTGAISYSLQDHFLG